MENIIKVFIILYVKRVGISRRDLSTRLNISERQVTRYINSINAMLVEEYIYEQVKYSKSSDSYNLENLLE